MVRYGLVAGADTLKQLNSYMPDNYHVHPYWLNGTVNVIYGEDKAGWTMDDYIIPRLASGLIQCVEIPYHFGKELTK